MKSLLLVLFSIISLQVFAQDASINKNRSYIAAQEFVKQKLKFPKEAEFNNSIVHETQGSGKCTVLGKVIAKNALGIKTEYSYKIWLIHNGKDWTEQANWQYSKLILEDTSTRKQDVFTNSSTGVKLTKDTSTKKIGTVNGISCTIIERNSIFTRLVTSKKMTESQIKKAISDLNISTSIVYFHLALKKASGQEYAMRNKDLILIY